MKKLKTVGILFTLAGIGIILVGGFISMKAKSGIDSLNAVYEAQKVMVSYDDAGNFIDGGAVETGNEILSLLKNDWQFPLNRKNLDPNDPLVNTPDELMLQYARISYHILHGTQTIELDETVEYEGVLFPAGTYEFDVGGRYWQDFDRSHPLEGPAREKAWTGTAHGLLANLATGTATHNFALFVLYFGYMAIGLGLIFLVSGLLFISAGKENQM